MLYMLKCFIFLALLVDALAITKQSDRHSKSTDGDGDSSQDSETSIKKQIAKDDTITSYYTQASKLVFSDDEDSSYISSGDGGSGDFEPRSPEGSGSGYGDYMETLMVDSSSYVRPKSGYFEQNLNLPFDTTFEAQFPETGDNVAKSNKLSLQDTSLSAEDDKPTDPDDSRLWITRDTASRDSGIDLTLLEGTDGVENSENSLTLEREPQEIIKLISTIDFDSLDDDSSANIIKLHDPGLIPNVNNHMPEDEGINSYSTNPLLNMSEITLLNRLYYDNVAGSSSGSAMKDDHDDIDFLSIFEEYFRGFTQMEDEIANDEQMDRKKSHFNENSNQNKFPFQRLSNNNVEVTFKRKLPIIDESDITSGKINSLSAIPKKNKEKALRIFQNRNNNDSLESDLSLETDYNAAVDNNSSSLSDVDTEENQTIYDTAPTESTSSAKTVMFNSTVPKKNNQAPKIKANVNNGSATIANTGRYIQTIAKNLSSNESSSNYTNVTPIQVDNVFESSTNKESSQFRPELKSNTTNSRSGIQRLLHEIFRRSGNTSKTTATLNTPETIKTDLFEEFNERENIEYANASTTVDYISQLISSNISTEIHEDDDRSEPQTKGNDEKRILLNSTIQAITTGYDNKTRLLSTTIQEEAPRNDVAKDLLTSTIQTVTEKDDTSQLQTAIAETETEGNYDTGHLPISTIQTETHGSIETGQISTSTIQTETSEKYADNELYVSTLQPETREDDAKGQFFSSAAPELNKNIITEQFSSEEMRTVLSATPLYHESEFVSNDATSAMITNMDHFEYEYESSREVSNDNNGETTEISIQTNQTFEENIDTNDLLYTQEYDSIQTDDGNGIQESSGVTIPSETHIEKSTIKKLENTGIVPESTTYSYGDFIKAVSLNLMNSSDTLPLRNARVEITTQNTPTERNIPLENNSFEINHLINESLTSTTHKPTVSFMNTKNETANPILNRSIKEIYGQVSPNISEIVVSTSTPIELYNDYDSKENEKRQVNFQGSEESASPMQVNHHKSSSTLSPDILYEANTKSIRTAGQGSSNASTLLPNSEMFNATESALFVTSAITSAPSITERPQLKSNSSSYTLVIIVNGKVIFSASSTKNALINDLHSQIVTDLEEITSNNNQTEVESYKSEDIAESNQEAQIPQKDGSVKSQLPMNRAEIQKNETIRFLQNTSHAITVSHAKDTHSDSSVFKAETQHGPSMIETRETTTQSLTQTEHSIVKNTVTESHSASQDIELKEEMNSEYFTKVLPDQIKSFIQSDTTISTESSYHLLPTSNSINIETTTRVLSEFASTEVISTPSVYSCPLINLEVTSKHGRNTALLEETSAIFPPLVHSICIYGFMLGDHRVDIDLLIPNTSSFIPFMGEYNLHLAVDSQFLSSQKQTQLWGRIEHGAINENEVEDSGYVTSMVFDTTGKEIIDTNVRILWNIGNNQEISFINSNNPFEEISRSVNSQFLLNDKPTIALKVDAEDNLIRPKTGITILSSTNATSTIDMQKSDGTTDSMDAESLPDSFNSIETSTSLDLQSIGNRPKFARIFSDRPPHNTTISSSSNINTGRCNTYMALLLSALAAIHFCVMS